MRKYIPFMIVVAAIAVIAGVGLAGKNDNKTINPSPNNSSNTNSTEPMNHMPTPAPSSETSSTNKVSISNFNFSPAEITVKKGTTVTWTNNDSVAHTVTAYADKEHGPNSPLIDPGKTYSFTFDDEGTFAYHCEPHPNMKGKVIVTE